MEIIFFLISGAILFAALKLLTSMPCIPSNQKLLYVKETQPEESQNEGIVRSVLPTKGKPVDSEGEEKNIGLKIWL